MACTYREDLTLQWATRWQRARGGARCEGLCFVAETLLQQHNFGTSWCTGMYRMSRISYNNIMEGVKHYGGNVYAALIKCDSSKHTW